MLQLRIQKTNILLHLPHDVVASQSVPSLHIIFSSLSQSWTAPTGCFCFCSRCFSCSLRILSCSRRLNILKMAGFHWALIGIPISRWRPPHNSRSRAVGPSPFPSQCCCWCRCLAELLEQWKKKRVDFHQVERPTEKPVDSSWNFHHWY